MKLRNVSELFATETVREVVGFVRPPGISNFQVRITKHGWAFAGRAYPEAEVPKVIIKIHQKLKFPFRREAHGGYLPLELYTFEEVLVYLLAHELRHIWQGRVVAGYRVWGARGQYSERDACAYGIQKVRQWRRK